MSRRFVRRNKRQKGILGYGQEVDAFVFHDKGKETDGGEETQSLISAKQFRPNFIVSGGYAYQEDTWKELAFYPRIRKGGDKTKTETDVQKRPVKFSVTGPCSRCHMVNIDQVCNSHNCVLENMKKYQNQLFSAVFC